jgi:hypothetical protein
LDVLRYGLIAEQCAILEQNAPPDLQPYEFTTAEAGYVLPQHLNTALRWPLQSNDRP